MSKLFFTKKVSKKIMIENAKTRFLKIMNNISFKRRINYSNNIVRQIKIWVLTFNYIIFIETFLVLLFLS